MSIEQSNISGVDPLQLRTTVRCGANRCPESNLAYPSVPGHKNDNSKLRPSVLRPSIIGEFDFVNRDEGVTESER